MSRQPWTFEQAHTAQTAASNSQRAAEEFVKSAYRQYAEAERAYREALAAKITELRAAGQPTTVVQDLAKGDKHVAGLKYQRDVAEGMKEASSQASWRASADRRATEGFCDWSMRRELAEGYGRAPDPMFSKPIGARAA